MAKSDKDIVADELDSGKVKVLLMPISVVSLLYGAQIIMYPDILANYHVYILLQSIINADAIGAGFIILSAALLSGYFSNNHTLLRISSTALFALWSMYTVAFFLSPPPNTIWITSALIAYFSFSITRRV